MAVSLIPIIIQGVIKLAPPSVAKFLIQHGFKKASQTAVRGKTNIPKVSSRQAKDIVNTPTGYTTKELKEATERILKKRSKKRARMKQAGELKKKFPKAIQEEENVLKNIQAEDLTTDPKLLKMFKSGLRPMKKGGRVGKPKGVGAAQRGYGKAMKRGK